MRNDANRLNPTQLQRLREWLEGLLAPKGADERSQREIADLTGVSQPTISNVLRGGNVTRGTATQMLERASGDADFVLGDGAGVADTKYRERDDMPARGFALDALSLVYEEDFCDLIQQMTPPPGSEGWTVDSWVDHIQAMRKLWQSGHLRPKRLRTRSIE